MSDKATIEDLEKHIYKELNKQYDEPILKEKMESISQIKHSNNIFEQSIKENLVSQVTNPLRLQITKTQVSVKNDSFVPLKIKEGARLNEMGFIEEISETTFFIGDDGITDSKTDFTQCQTCKGWVHKSSIRRCLFCRKICCVSHKCATTK